MDSTSVLSLVGFACLVIGGIIVTRICWAEGITTPWGSYRLVYKGLRGQASERGNRHIRAAVALWVAAATLLVAAFVAVPAV